MKKERILLLILATVQFTSIMDFMIMMPLGPQLMRLFHITPQQFGFVVSAYTISAGIFGFLAAFIIDKFDRKNVLLVIYIGFTIGTFACAMAPTYTFLLLARILTGAFGGVIGALVLSIVGDAIPFERRATAMGTVMAAFSVASVFGVPFGLFIANKFDWHAPFFFLAIIATLVAALIYFFIPKMNTHIQEKKQGTNTFVILTDILKNNNQLRALLLMILLMMAQFSIIPFISPYMVSNVGFTEHQLAYIYLLGGAFTIFTSPLVGKLSDKFGKAKIFTIFVLISVFPLFLITNMGRAPIPLALVITTIFFITVGGRIIPAMTMITGTVAPRNRGSFMSINSSVQQLTAGIAAFIAGAIIQKSKKGELLNYEYVGFIAITASLLCIIIARKLKSVDSNPPAEKISPPPQ